MFINHFKKLQKMKKIILGIVFVFATGTIVNASTSINQNPDEFECAEFAWNKADEVNASYAEAAGHNYSDWDMWELTNHHFEECMNGNN